jgi:hypothetical protein
VRAYVVEHMGDPKAVPVVNETGISGRDHDRWGAASVHRHRGPRRQCPGRGLAVYASDAGHALIDRELYLIRVLHPGPLSRIARANDAPLACEPAKVGLGDAG